MAKSARRRSAPSSSKKPPSPPKKQRTRKKLPFWKTLSKKTRTYALYVARALGVIVIGTLFLVLTTGLRPSIPSFLKTKDTAKTQQTDQPESAKICAAPQTKNANFAKCASFGVDYSQPGKSIGEYFNMYVGKPEGNEEVQYYTDSSKNLRIDKDTLTLTALQEPMQGYRYTSARLDTRGKKNGEFLYGKVVVRAILPNAVGAWPAIWLLPSDHKYPQTGTVSDEEKRISNGEIDFAESTGVEPHVVYGVVHNSFYHDNIDDRTHYNTVAVPDSDTAYHNYGVEWTPSQITMSVDDVPFFTYTKPSGSSYKSWPFDQRFYLIINLAVGGWSASPNRKLFPNDGVDTKALPVSMNVQSVSYYPYIGPR